jgi:hypothetical protein
MKLALVYVCANQSDLAAITVAGIEVFKRETSYCCWARIEASFNSNGKADVRLAED